MEKSNEKLTESNEKLTEIEVDPRIKGDWSVMGTWNNFLTFLQNERELKERDYIWATEIGRGTYERWLKMTATPPDKGYTERVLRKFSAGDIFERLIGFFLCVNGLLKLDNEHIEIPETENMLKVTGKLDFLAGGKPKSWEEIEIDPFASLFFEFFPSFKEIARQLNRLVLEKYPNGLKPLIYEIKSINSQIFWAKKDYLPDAYFHHRLQLYTYLRQRNMPEGRVLYISKDDLCLAEFPVYLDDQKMKDAWEKDVLDMTKIYRDWIDKGIEPEKPPMIIFDERKKIKFQFEKKGYEIKGCWKSNWEISWSNYITKMGFKDVDDYERKANPLCKEKNDEIKEKYKIANNLVKK